VGSRSYESWGDDQGNRNSFEGGGLYPRIADPHGIWWCPECGARMDGDATHCAECGDVVVPAHRSLGPARWWVWLGIAVVGLGLLAGLAAAFKGLNDALSNSFPH
jgi:hypothetical protein